MIRTLNHISRDEYLKSLGTESLGSIISGQTFFKGLQTAGKSGSFFFTSADDRYFVKTIPEREFLVAVEILSYYSNFLNSNYDEDGNVSSLISQ